MAGRAAKILRRAEASMKIKEEKGGKRDIEPNNQKERTTNDVAQTVRRRRRCDYGRQSSPEVSMKIRERRETEKRQNEKERTRNNHKPWK